MAFLLDVNVLIALVDEAHVFHDPAHEWFEAEGADAWATCPITENALLRIVGSPKYPNSPGGPADVAPTLEALRGLPGWRFWPDALSILSTDRILADRLLTSAQVTDAYLLAIAASNGGKLATFDRRLNARAVVGGAEALRVIA